MIGATLSSAPALCSIRASPAPVPAWRDAPQMSDACSSTTSSPTSSFSIHELRWPLVDAARPARAHAHLKDAIALSRASWKAILAETDDDREWIPGPQQKNPAIPGMTVTQEQVDTWLGFLEDADAVLDGRKLLPHWRFTQGVNLKRALLEPRDFDLVLWAAGQAAAPYLETGPILSWADWRKWNVAFHDNFLGYAFYFN